MIFILTGSALFIVIALFVFPLFSPVPYFPANKKDLSLILRALRLKDNQVVFDLGAGDGIVIFEAAKEAFERRLNTTFVAIEINPVLVGILYLQRLFHPNKRNIKIVWTDMFKFRYNSLTLEPVNSITFFLYISPWLMERLFYKLVTEFKRFEVVSYFYPLPKAVRAKTIMSRKYINSVSKYEFIVP